MPTTTRLRMVAGFAAVFFYGCGTSSAPDVPTVAGSKTVTFFVKDMGERLNLL